MNANKNNVSWGKITIKDIIDNIPNSLPENNSNVSFEEMQQYYFHLEQKEKINEHMKGNWFKNKASTCQYVNLNPTKLEDKRYPISISRERLQSSRNNTNGVAINLNELVEAQNEMTKQSKQIE